MDSKEATLIQMKSKLDAARDTMQQYKGQLEILTTQLKDLGFKNIDEAEERLNELDDELAAKEAAFQKGVRALEENYDWNAA